MDALFGPINKWLDGKKTTLGLIGATITALSVIFGAVVDGLQMADFQLIAGTASAWLVAIGLGHKAAKIEDALKKPV